ncbi:type I DNA topoisomerase [Thermodesulfovibrio sp. TK110]
MELKRKNLIIVESPAKAKTINKIVGKDFEVKASIGHIKDLPEDRLGVDIKRGFQPEYIIIPGKEKIVKELRESAKNAQKIFIATDPDREGEAIAYHIAEEIKADEFKVYRAIFHEITPNAVKAAIENPSKIDLNKVYSQQARRILDRLVGYNLSPMLWKKVKKGLSAGRVQSVALRMVVEREKEILTHQPIDYWTIHGKFQNGGEKLHANLYKYKNKLIVDRTTEKSKFLITTEEDAQKILKTLKNLSYTLTKVEKKRKKKNPPEPFRTATLQGQASSVLGFSPKKTMMIAQQLYEGIDIEGNRIGLITYMRTDSVRISEEAKQWAKKIIEKTFGKEFIGTNTNTQTKGKIIYSQDAHECIRPTYPDKSPEVVKKYLTKEQYALYKLIWDRFLASQMAPAVIEQTTYIIEDTTHPSDDSNACSNDGQFKVQNSMNVAQFRASGSVVVFPGFLVLYKDEETEQRLLPLLEEKTQLKLVEIESEKHTTEPPPRYTEATLVKALEEKGIGRPSTYATILSTIQERGYVKKIKTRLYPTYLGFVVNDLLEEKFPELMDYNFTAKMEEDLDKISLNEVKWNKVIEEFYRKFEKDLEEALKIGKRTKPKEIKTPLKCEKCGKDMVIRWSKGLPFLACSGYPVCRNTRSLKNNNNAPETTDKICPECGALLVIRKGKRGEFIACSRYPECKYTQPITADIKCPECGGDIVKKQTKKGRSFWACSNYPECKFTLPTEPVGVECPECKASYMLKKKDKKGEEFLICHNKACKGKIKINENSAGTDPAQQKDVNPARSGRKQR